jgi:hypothetical protein
MTTLDLTNKVSVDTFSVHTGSRIDDQARMIKRAMSAYRKLLRSNPPTTAWGTTINVAKVTGVGAQDLNGCGCGCC